MKNREPREYSSKQNPEHPQGLRPMKKTNASAKVYTVDRRVRDVVQSTGVYAGSSYNRTRIALQEIEARREAGTPVDEKQKWERLVQGLPWLQQMLGDGVITVAQIQTLIIHCEMLWDWDRQNERDRLLNLANLTPDKDDEYIFDGQADLPGGPMSVVRAEEKKTVGLVDLTIRRTTKKKAKSVKAKPKTKLELKKLEAKRLEKELREMQKRVEVQRAVVEREGL